MSRDPWSKCGAAATANAAEPGRRPLVAGPEPISGTAGCTVGGSVGPVGPGVAPGVRQTGMEAARSWVQHPLEIAATGPAPAKLPDPSRAARRTRGRRNGYRRSIDASPLPVPDDARQPRLEVDQIVDVAVEDRARRAIDQAVGAPLGGPIRPLRPDRDAHPAGTQAQAVDLSVRFAFHPELQ